MQRSRKRKDAAGDISVAAIYTVKLILMMIDHLYAQAARERDQMATTITRSGKITRRGINFFLGFSTRQSELSLVLLNLSHPSRQQFTLL